jgi:hypothetical protein
MSFKEALDNFRLLYDEILATGSLRQIAPLDRDYGRISYDLHLYYIAYKDGDTDVCTDCENDILEILTTHGFTVDELPIDIINSGGGSGVIPLDRIWDWDGVNHWYQPYQTRAEVTTGLKFYSESANEIPDANVTGSLSLNGRFTSGSSNLSYSGFGLQGQSYSGSGAIGRSVTGNGSYGYSTSGIGGFFSSTSGTGIYVSITSGKAALFETSGTALTGNKSTNLIETKSNENAGIYDVSGIIHYTEDNPTLTSGENTKIYFSYKCGTTTRTEAYPRVPDGTGNKAYLWDTETALSAANHTEYKNNGTLLKTLKSTGTEEILRGQYVYHRQVIGTDTDGDIRTYSNASGYFIERRESGVWVSKWDITF